jgi:hypothetical protein
MNRVFTEVDEKEMWFSCSRMSKTWAYVAIYTKIGVFYRDSIFWEDGYGFKGGTGSNHRTLIAYSRV